ncbi:MAG: hypothetical protein WA209_14170 [Candidatus Acidiferrales bacterium]
MEEESAVGTMSTLVDSEIVVEVELFEKVALPLPELTIVNVMVADGSTVIATTAWETEIGIGSGVKEVNTTLGVTLSLITSTQSQPQLSQTWPSISALP